MNKIKAKEGKAFVGVSLDSNQFPRSWIRSALQQILRNHQSVLILLADDLLRYTRTAQGSGENPTLDFDRASKYVKNRGDEWQRFLTSEIERLASSDSSRVELKHWGDFCDSSYVSLFRALRIAYDVIPAFQTAVNDAVARHIAKGGALAGIPRVDVTSVSFIIDEVAMCLRVAEIGDYHYEYYPFEEINVLTQLYAGAFEPEGLSIEVLVGRKPLRTFCVFR